MRFILTTLFTLSMLFSAGAAIDTTSQNFYMFIYFIQGELSQADGARLALSTDGVTWEKYNNEAPIIRPEVSSRGELPLMRDPNTYYDSSTGVFHLTWTTAWNQDNVGYATSRDLKNWSKQVMIPVGRRIRGCSVCWAPEFFYDDTRDSIMLYWSTSRGGEGKEAFCSFTKDFKTYTYPEVYFTPKTNEGNNYTIIDETILKVAERKYYLFFKDERQAGKQGVISQVIRCTFADNPKGPWWAGPNQSASQDITDIGFEGPTAYIINDDVRLVTDPFTPGGHERTDRVKTVKLSELQGEVPPTTWNKGPVMKTSTGQTFLPSHGSISKIPKEKVLQLLYNIPDKTVYSKSWTDLTQNDIVVKNATDKDFDLGKQNCGCGTGVGLAFLPPIIFKGWALRRRKKQDSKTK